MFGLEKVTGHTFLRVPVIHSQIAMCMIQCVDSVIMWLLIRKQVTVTNGNMSEPRHVTCGVRTPGKYKHCTVSLYADDTFVMIPLLCIIKSPWLRKLCKWLICNGLLLNEKNETPWLLHQCAKSSHSISKVQVKMNYSSCIPGRYSRYNQFSGLCSDEVIFFTLRDRPSFPHYNNIKIIKFSWELFILWIISYGL